ncbi:hypothetical protein [Anabaena sp. CCY 9402-a]|uniref:hypothetical protein n=1 Tax=Anabaena sp. CCY 9402-a TaxID=3103867 RepID=UPI0039C61FB8
MGVVSKLLSQNKEEQSSTPNKFHSIVLWKTQNQQNKKPPNGNLVAFRRSSASPAIINTFSLEKIYGCPLTTVYGGDANIKPTHLSFLIGGTGKHTKGNLKTVIEGWRCRTPRQPSAKKL